MLRLTAGRFLFLVVLAFSVSVSARAQEDCVYGLKIYARDEAGKAIPDAKVEVKGLRKRGGQLIPVEKLFNEDAYFVGVLGEGVKLNGDYLLKVSGAGFEPYERQFKFPVCEIQSYELRLPATGSKATARFDRLFTLHGKIFDEERKPFGNALVEVRSADGRIFQTSSNAYGYFKLDVPGGTSKVRVSNNKIPDAVFDDYKVEKNYTVLNVPVCLKCGRGQAGN